MFLYFCIILLASLPVYALEHRAAVDIGSGMIKMQDALVDTHTNTIIHLGEPFFAKAA